MNKLKTQLIKDSFKYSRKRKSTTKSIIIATIAIIGSTIIASLIAAMFGYDPFETLRILFTAAFINEPEKFAYMLSVFALAAFAFSFAFKAGIFNIGISGQMYAAGVTLLIVTNALKDVMFPPFIGQIFSLFIAMSVGAIVALITGAMERYLKVNSVVSAIILNWIILLIGFFVISAWYSNSLDYSQMTASKDIPAQFTLGAGNIAGWIPAIIIVVIVATILLILSKYTVFGHKINSTGLSLEGSRYAGYNVNVIKLATFAISGALSGVLAVILYTARTPNIPATIINVIVPVEGFNGIAVGLIASNNPIGIIAVSAIIGLFKTSSSFLPMSPVFNDVIIGLLMLGASLTVIMYKYRPWIYILKKRYASEVDKSYNVYENKIDSIISKYKSIYSVYKNVNLKEERLDSEIIDNAFQEERSSYNSIDEILDDYLHEINIAKNKYKEDAINEWMLLKLRPQKYIKLSKEQQESYYDEKLTLYVSKQKSKISFENELIKKGKNDKSFIDKLLLNDIERRNKMITKSVKQNKEWKTNNNKRIEKKYSKQYSINISQKLLTSETILTYKSFDQKLNKINQNAIKMIKKDINDVGVREQLFNTLAEYNNEIIKNGGKAC